MMRKILVLPVVLAAFLVLAGCSGEPATGERLDSEFVLPIGSEAVIQGEDLRIFFDDVVEDSRCPIGVQCVWEGQARYALRLTKGDTSERIVMTESGSGVQADAAFLDYRITAHIEPYPEAPDGIEKGDYSLRITVTKEAASPYSLDDQADIYAAVIRQLYLVDHSFGSSPPDFPNLYIVYLTDETAGGNFSGNVVSRVITQQLRDKIDGLLNDLPAEITWVDSFQSVPLNEDSTVQGGGAVVRVGNIDPGEAGAVDVPGSIYIANLAASGRTYVLEKRGTWQIIGTTGPVWMS
jgi:hypothetical protein